MAALPDADPNSWCSPPGLGGVWRVKHVRSGLTRRVLVRTPDGLVFAQAQGHAICKSCAQTRGKICNHCTCIVCVWEREVEERGALVNRSRVLALAAKLRNFEMGRKPIVELLPDD